MNPPALGYLSEQDKAWSAALRAATTLEDLQALAKAWGRWTPDVRGIVLAMTAADFAAFRDGLAKESRGEFAGEEYARRFSAVLMPERLFEISLRAAQFGVPFGTMAIRIAEVQPHHQKWRWLPALVKESEA